MHVYGDWDINRLEMAQEREWEWEWENEIGAKLHRHGTIFKSCWNDLVSIVVGSLWIFHFEIQVSKNFAHGNTSLRIINNCRQNAHLAVASWWVGLCICMCMVYCVWYASVFYYFLYIFDTLWFLFQVVNTTSNLKSYTHNAIIFQSLTCWLLLLLFFANNFKDAIHDISSVPFKNTNHFEYKLYVASMANHQLFALELVHPNWLATVSVYICFVVFSFILTYDAIDFQQL